MAMQSFIALDGKHWKVDIASIVAVFENDNGYGCLLLKTGTVVPISDSYAGAVFTVDTGRAAASIP